MKTNIVTPVALIAVLSGVVSVGEEAAPMVLSEESAFSACLAGRPFVRGETRRYDDMILRQSRRRGLNPGLVKSIIAAESQFMPAAVSRCGARGLMQVMPATAVELGFEPSDLSDPETNISAGTAYLARLFKAAGRERGKEGPAPFPIVSRVIAGYHSGPGAMDAEAWTPATRRYVHVVLNCYASAEGVSSVQAQLAF